MASGDLTASLPVKIDANDPSALKVAIDLLSLTAVTDTLFVVPLVNQKLLVFKVEREA